MKVNKRTIFEVFLVVVIALQSFVIYRLYILATDTTFSDINNMMDNYACSKKVSILFDLSDSDDFEALLNYSERLHNNGWDNDKIVLHSMSRAYYSKGDRTKAIEYLNKAIVGEYFCEFSEPLPNGIQIDEAIARYSLAELYEETGEQEKAQYQFSHAFKIAKQGFGEKYNKTVFLKLCKNASYKNIEKQDT